MLKMTAVVGALLANVAAIGTILFLFRNSIYCGLGIGFLAQFIYVPSLVLLGGTYLFEVTPAVRNFRYTVVALNAAYVVIVLFGGSCYSCVNICVEQLQGN